MGVQLECSCGSGLSSDASLGLGFWRVGSRILAAPQASEIGGVGGRRRALCWEYRVSFWGVVSRKYPTSFAESVLFRLPTRRPSINTRRLRTHNTAEAHLRIGLLKAGLGAV